MTTRRKVKKQLTTLNTKRNAQSLNAEKKRQLASDNFMLQYLRKGKLAYIFGNTLFLHGAIDPKTMVFLYLKTKNPSVQNSSSAIASLPLLSGLCLTVCLPLSSFLSLPPCVSCHKQ